MLGEAGEEEEIEGTGVPSPLSISWLPLLVAPSGSIAPGLVARVGSLPLRSNRGRPGMGPRCRDGETCSLPACEIYEFQRMSPAKSRPGVLMSGLAGQSRGSQPPAQPWRCKGRPLLLAQCQMDPSRILQTRAPLSNLDSGNLGAMQMRRPIMRWGYEPLRLVTQQVACAHTLNRRPGKQLESSRARSRGDGCCRVLRNPTLVYAVRSSPDAAVRLLFV
jgi:hypothetical protein